ncbi:MAG: c-type cytochrome [Bradyrhizobium sp.]|nr:c-type cytochrome [Bradyrhizobium sp.]
MPRRRHGLVAILMSLVLCGAFRSEAAEPSAETIARGKALVVAGDCAGCHTADPAKPFAGGKRIDSAFGAIYAPNLTPDNETGLGKWRDEDFLRALRQGIAPDGSRYYPAFPYPYFTKLIRDDILAIRAYLGSIEPVRNKVAPPEPRFPFNFRAGMRLWNWLYLQPGIMMPDQSRGTEWNRGRYLVEGIGHCGTCHASKNLLGGDKGPPGFATWLRNWSADDVAEYLRSGRSPRSDPRPDAGSLMREVIANSTSKMSDGDIRAMAVYLKSLYAR